MKKSTGVILVLIIVLLLGVIGVGSYFFIKGNNDTNKEIGDLKNEVANLGKNAAKTSNIQVTNDNQTNNTDTTSTNNQTTTSNTQSNTNETTTSFGDEYASLKVAIKNAYIKKITQNENVLEYRIEGIEILTSEEIKSEPGYGRDYNENDTLAIVNYSLRLKDITGSGSAGNGRISGDWIINKTACVVYKNGEITQEGTSF